MTELSEEIRVISAADADPASLDAFYKIIYPERFDFMKNNWRWLNRTSYLNNKVPLVIVSGDRVIAHAGLIPVKLMIGGDKYSAAWFIDLAVLPEFRGLGYGSILVKKREDMAEIKMTFPNDNSRGIFSRFSWQECSQSYMHYILIAPFNHQRFARRLPSPIRVLLNKATFSFMALKYKRYAGINTDSCIENLNERSLEQLRDKYTESLKKRLMYIYPERDKDFIQWRIQNSPHRNQYFIYSAGELHALVYMNTMAGGNIDVLWVSDMNDMSGIRNMLSVLALAGIRKEYSFIRFLTTRKILSAYIRQSVRPIIKTRKFFYTSGNDYLKDKCINSGWDLELIDSDLEYTN